MRYTHIASAYLYENRSSNMYIFHLIKKKCMLTVADVGKRIPIHTELRIRNLSYGRFGSFAGKKRDS